MNRLDIDRNDAATPACLLERFRCRNGGFNMQLQKRQLTMAPGGGGGGLGVRLNMERWTGADACRPALAMRRGRGDGDAQVGNETRWRRGHVQANGS